MATTTTVAVRDLAVGDYLPGTRQTVTHRPARLTRTPKGHVTLGLRRDGDDTAYAVNWRPSTTVGIAPKAVA